MCSTWADTVFGAMPSSSAIAGVRAAVGDEPGDARTRGPSRGAHGSVVPSPRGSRDGAGHHVALRDRGEDPSAATDDAPRRRPRPATERSRPRVGPRSAGWSATRPWPGRSTRPRTPPTPVRARQPGVAGGARGRSRAWRGRAVGQREETAGVVDRRAACPGSSRSRELRPRPRRARRRAADGSPPARCARVPVTANGNR